MKLGSPNKYLAALTTYRPPAYLVPEVFGPLDGPVVGPGSHDEVVVAVAFVVEEEASGVSPTVTPRHPRATERATVQPRALYFSALSELTLESTSAGSITSANFLCPAMS